MLLPPNSALSSDPVLHTLRSLVARGRHAEADRLAEAQKRRCCAGQGGLFLGLRAEIALGLGGFAKALNWASEAMKRLSPADEISRSIEDSRIRALLGLGRFREALSVVESSLASRDSGSADLSMFRAQAALHSGRLPEAKKAADLACALALAAGERAQLIEALLLRARTSRETGDTEAARRDLDRAQGLSRGLRDASVLPTVLSDRADLMAHSGDWAEAGRNAGQSARLFARTLSPHEHLSAGRRTGLVGLAQDEPGVALLCIERAAYLARRGYGTVACRAEIDLLLADAQLAGKDPEGALERATAALSFFQDSQDPGGLARAHVRRSLAALAGSYGTLALREARRACSIRDAGPVAEGLADLALGRVLLPKDPSGAAAAFGRASQNLSLYPPLQSVAHLGVALSRGASPQGDTVGEHLKAIEAFGDRRIMGIVRADLKENFGVEPASALANRAVACIVKDPYGLDDGLDVEDSGPEFLPGLVGASPAVRLLGEEIRKIAPSDLPVSIYGETGTGKEKIAEAVHHFSSRSRQALVPFNAASLSDELFESQLFGHVRGSFTGAHEDRSGLVEAARGGTLFIDEIADLSSRAQVGLLRFIEQGTYRRLGDTRERRADVRIVVAANRRLEDLVATGHFRQDLLERIKGFCVSVPPLRDRGRDIIRLARCFLARASGGTRRLSAHSEAELREHAWPGNVRELQMEMRRAVVLTDSPVVEWRRPKAAPDRAAAATALPGSAEASASLQEVVGGFERRHLKSVLSQCAARVEAARILGISRQALHQKIVRYGL